MSRTTDVEERSAPVYEFQLVAVDLTGQKHPRENVEPVNFHGAIAGSVLYRPGR